MVMFSVFFNLPNFYRLFPFSLGAQQTIFVFITISGSLHERLELVEQFLECDNDFLSLVLFALTLARSSLPPSIFMGYFSFLVIERQMSNESN